ncbi:MAG: hypothetical protein IT580_02640 [Verrucomicrobiales bacterium]|nr:hypothetical protein [Verrucomicrobiales bacterium]
MNTTERNTLLVGSSPVYAGRRACRQTRRARCGTRPASASASNPRAAQPPAPAWLSRLSDRPAEFLAANAQPQGE